MLFALITRLKVMIQIPEKIHFWSIHTYMWQHLVWNLNYSTLGLNNVNRAICCSSILLHFVICPISMRHKKNDHFICHMWSVSRQNHLQLIVSKYFFFLFFCFCSIYKSVIAKLFIKYTAEKLSPLIIYQEK